MAEHVDDEDALRLVLNVHRLVRDLRRSLPAADLQPTQLLMLTRLLEDGPMRLGELATKVPCSQPTATSVIAGLEPEGLVQRDADPNDRRAIQLAITDRGHERLLTMARREAALLKDGIATFDDDDQRCLVRALGLLEQLTLS